MTELTDGQLWSEVSGAWSQTFYLTEDVINDKRETLEESLARTVLSGKPAWAHTPLPLQSPEYY